MNRQMVFTSLLFTLAICHVNVSWADVAKPLGKIASECGPVFSSATIINQKRYSDRLLYSDRKASVIREYFVTQRRALTYEAVAEQLEGRDFEPGALAEDNPLLDGCFTAFTTASKASDWESLAKKIDSTKVDQTLEDMIAEKVPKGYQRIMDGSKKMRAALPFQMDELVARRLVFDPPQLVLYAEAPAGTAASTSYDVKTPFCSALTRLHFDQALYPLIKVRVFEGPNGSDHALATASGSQCYQ
ncbi:hypothetical protein IFT48_01815 [Pseudomonas fluorescens]|nr:hypothetical protein [Pseudomonas fluorescens]